MSGSGQTAARMQEQRNMAELQAFLQEGLRSEQVLQHRLQALKEANRQQLQETVKRQREGLEKRIQQNSMLSVGVGDGSRADRQLEEFFSYQARSGGPKRSSSMSDLSSGMETASASRTSPQVRQSDKPVTSSTSWACATTIPQRVNGTPKASQKAPPQPQHLGLAEKEPIRLSKEEEEEAECQRKFRAVPVPGHVFLPLYQDMMQVRELERKNGHEQRRDFLLSMQKPFSFLERAEKKREKLMLSTVAQKTQKTKVVRKPIPKAIKDPAVSEHLKEEELCRKIRIQMRAQETLRNSTAPIDIQTHSDKPGPHSAQRPKREILAFLDEKPTFQPKTNAQVPDFNRLHQAFQREALRKAERKEVTRCQPFRLRTSTLPTRQSRTSSEKAQEPTVSAPLRRSKSFGGLTSLSRDTLPTYITDAARKRCMAIRKSVAQRESQEQEGAEWMRRSRMRSQAMQKTVAIRAKVMDPHSSLKEVYHEKLKQHREADQQRMREYRRELQDMKARVTVRPYLFEQVTQRTAKAEAERIYRNKLKEAGLNEHFVETKGEKTGVTPGHISGEEDDDDDDDDGGGDDDQSTENNIQKREGSVDDGEKIEEVEEESVKTKAEKMQ